VPVLACLAFTTQCPEEDTVVSASVQGVAGAAVWVVVVVVVGVLVWAVAEVVDGAVVVVGEVEGRTGKHDVTHNNLLSTSRSVGGDIYA